MPSKKTATRAGARQSTRGKTASRAKSAPRKTQAEPKNTGREAAGVIVICLGLLSCYFALTTDATGFAGSVRAIMLGLAGNLCFLLPLIICWGGLILAFSARQKSTDPGRICLIGALFLIVFGFVELFFVDDILREVRLNNYGGFLAQAFRAQKGAGLLGGLTAWPLYEGMRLRVWGSAIVYVALAIVDLILMHKISLSRLRDSAQSHIETYQQHFEERREERREVREERRQARADRIAADRTRRQLVIPRADVDAPGRLTKGRRPLSPAEDAFFQPEKEEETPAPAPKKTRRAVEDIQPPLTGSTQEAAAESALDEKPAVNPVLAERSRPRRERAPIEDDIPPFDPEDDFFGGRAEPPFPEAFSGRGGKSDSRKAPVSRREDPIPPREPESTLPEEPEEDEAPVPGASLIEEPREPRVKPAEPLPSFGAEKVIYNGIHAPATDKPDIPEGEEEPEEPAAAPAEPELPFDLPPRRAPVSAPAAPAVPEPPEYNYPPVDLLEASKPSLVGNQEEADMAKGRKLVEVLSSFNISAQLTGISHGPTVTRFELAPASGTRVNKITGLVDDIALGLAAKSVRIEAPIPGKSAVGVEVPNDKVETVPLRDVLESPEAQKHPSRLAAAIGRDNAGRNIICDLAKMPHILIAGQTGAGKSVCINCIICSILYRARPEEVRMILIDPKMVELSVYNGVPHLLVPVVTDPKKAAGALEWIVNEMTQRYKKFAAAGAKDIKSYNQRRPETEPPMPQIVVIIDELADLMIVAPADVEDAIMRIAQLARAAGIHLVIATQRPSVNVITGVIKANIPSRIAFTVASQVDSRTILDIGGAEKLLGSGDMLYAPSGTNKPLRVQGAWVSEKEVESVVRYILDRHEAAYDGDLAEHLEKAGMNDAEREEADEQYDDLLPQAIEAAIDAKQASISMLQRKLRIGYARAGRLIDEMTRRKIISEADGAKPREVLISREQYNAQYKDQP